MATNSSLGIKKSIVDMRKAYEIDTDSLFAHLDKMKKSAEASKDPVEKSVYYSVLAHIYQQYYDNNRFAIDDRTDIDGPAPEDMREWTKKNFLDTIKGYVDASVKEKEALLKAPISDYPELVEKRKDSNLRPTMYDLLMHRAIDMFNYDTTQVYAYYEALIDAHKSDTIVRDAARLEYCNYKRDKESKYFLPYSDDFAESYKGSPLYVYAKALEIERSHLKDRQKHDICMELEKNYPDNPYLCSIINIREGIEKGFISFSCKNSDGEGTSNLLYPGVASDLKITYKNIRKAKLDLYRLDVSAMKYEKEYGKIKDSDYKLVSSEVIKLDPGTDFENVEYNHILKLDKCGIYYIRLTPDDKKTESISQHFFVTKYMSFEKNECGQAEVYVVDRLSGEPQKNIEVRWNDREGNGTVKTNDMGIAVIKIEPSRHPVYELVCGDDKYYPVNSFYSRYGDGLPNTYTYISFFLDRGIYRPGQKVMAKGIAYNKTGDEYSLCANKKITVNFNDANGKRITSKDVETNEYGSFYVDFDIPEGLMNGRFSLSTFNGRTTFRVEEYKRPTFEVKVDNVAATTISDTVYVRGNAKYYRGVGVSGGSVAYKVVSNPVYFYWWRVALPQIKDVVATGSAECDAEGNFSFQFMPSITPENDHPFYQFNVEIDVTDVSNETRTCTHSFVIGERSYSLSLPLNGLTDKDKLGDVIPEAYDCTGNKVTLDGTYTLTAKEVVMEGRFTSWKALDIDFKKLASGEYTLWLNTKDDKDRSIRTSNTFTLYSLSDTKPAVESVQWVIPVKTKCANGENAEVVLGSSFNAYTLMELYDGDSLVERKILNLKSRNDRLHVKYKETYSDRITLKMLTVYNGKSESKSVTIERVVKSRNLNIEYTHIKKVYEPAEKDKWSVRITDVDGKPLTAEVLVAMYDISLDALCSNSWYFNPVQKTFASPASWNIHSYNGFFKSRFLDSPTHSKYSFSYPSLNMFGFDLWRSRFYSYNERGAGGARVLYKGGAKDAMLMAVEETAEAPLAANAMADMADGSVEEAADEEINVRGNFAETAFFYPQLEAKDGALEFEITTPEALTGWKIMTLAHNKEIRTAVSFDTIVTQKTISVNANLPRFVRTTDSLALAATIDNLAAETKDVDVKWTVTDMASGDVVAQNSQIVNVGAESQGSSTCSVSVPKTAVLLKVRVTAKSGRFTDGIEMYVPVLSSQTLVTETMPICDYTEGVTDFNFESFANNKSETLVNRAFTINITPDAATMALQSLPYVGEPYFENAVEFALSYYVNWLSSTAVEKNKNLKAYLERLKEGTQTVKSPLEDNESLKNILLQESPWVMDAEFETSRNKSLVKLLDTKEQKNSRERMLKKLFKLQTSEGGFSWFEGGKPSPYITRFVVDQLQKTGYDSPELKRALKFLVVEMEKDYQEFLKYNKRGTYVPGYSNIYTMLMAGRQKTQSYTYCYGYIKDNWSQYTLPTQAVIAQVLFADGDKATAKRIINNIRKFQVFKPTMGLYWPNTSTVSTQADYIKAFATVDPDEEELAKMKLWLLFNKQTNMWRNSVETADALGALVFAGNSVGSEATRVIVKVGGVTLDSDSVQWAASMKQTFDNKHITPELAKVTVEKNNKTLTLGAAYWQYSEDVDKVEKHTDDRLKLEKTYYVEKNGMLTPVSLMEDIKTADKVVVRLVVTADREMEFIHLRDLRPAGLEPVKQISQYMVQSMLLYYMCTKDYSVDFFFDYMPKGTYVFEYQLTASLKGDYAAGFATIESMYSPDFKSQTKGCRMVIK